MNSDELFLSLYNEDSDGQSLNRTPGANELLTDYHDKFVSVCKEMYDYGKAQKDLRENEVNEFWKSLNEAKKNNTDEASEAINIFIEYKKNVKKKIYIFILQF